jgi:hypothetical protein
VGELDIDLADTEANLKGQNQRSNRQYAGGNEKQLGINKQNSSAMRSN